MLSKKPSLVRGASFILYVSVMGIGVTICPNFLIPSIKAVLVAVQPKWYHLVVSFINRIFIIYLKL